MTVRGSLLLALAATFAAGCTSTTASRNAGHVLRDCSDCPVLVVVVPEAGAAASLPEAIAVGRFEVTRDEFAAFEQDEPYRSPRCFFAFAIATFEDSMTRQHPGFGGFQPSGRDPAICVSWNEAQAYVDWLSRKTGEKYRLPSARELRFFERGNATTRYAWGDRSSDACLYANGLDQTADAQDWAKNVLPDLLEYLPTKDGVLDCDDGMAYTAPVGSYKPNGFGLYDTMGNVWEWTSDCVTDQTQWPEGSYFPPCTVGGGSWQSNPTALSGDPEKQILSSSLHEDVGFRVIRLLSDE